MGFEHQPLARQAWDTNKCATLLGVRGDTGVWGQVSNPGLGICAESLGYLSRKRAQQKRFGYLIACLPLFKGAIRHAFLSFHLQFSHASLSFHRSSGARRGNWRNCCHGASFAVKTFGSFILGLVPFLLL